MPSILCLLVLMPLAPVTGDGAEPVTATVLFYYGPEEYYWGDATTNRSADAIAMSMAAANAINRGFVYDEATGAVEIGGLRPGANDTWEWRLLYWDHPDWVPWTGNPHDMKLNLTSVLAWSPNDTTNPMPTPQSRYPWPMDRCGASRRGETLSPAPLTNLSYWATSLNYGYGMPTGQNLSIYSAPCVANGHVIVLASGRGRIRPNLFYLQEDNGYNKLHIELGGEGPQYCSPAFSEGMVLVGTNDGRFRALNGSRIQWTFNASDGERCAISSPAIARGRILFSTGEGVLHCLAMDGRPLWRANLSGPVLQPPGAPAVQEDRVVVGTQEGRLLCLELDNGSVIWNISLSGPVLSTPALTSEGYAFVLASAKEGDATGNMTLYSFYMRDGVQQWNATYPRSLSSPALAAGGMFLGTGTEIVGHHPDRGTKVWGIPYGRVDASPAVAQGYVYFATNTAEGIIACVRVGGSVEWTFAAGGPVFASPAVADGKLFVASENGTLWCLGRPPEPNLGAWFEAPPRAIEGEKVKAKAAFKNFGELPSRFSVNLAVDGKRTDIKKGPFELQPGESLNVSFEWIAKKGNHTLGLWDNSSRTVSFDVAIFVGGRPAGPADATRTLAVAACAAAFVLVATWIRRRRRRP